MSDMWFRLEKGDTRLPGMLVGNFNAVVSQSSWRTELYLQCLRLYSNLELMGIPGFSYQRFILPSNRLRLNVVQAVIDTQVALIATTRNKVKMMTTGGKFSRRRKSERLTRFLGGQFRHHNVYAMDIPSYQEAAILGMCGLGIEEEGDDLSIERVPATEVWVDEIEARHGDPRTLYRYTDMGRDEVAARYDLSIEDLMNVGQVLPKYQFRQQIENPIGVLQAWRLPSYPGADDGKCAVVLGDKLAPVHVDWKESKFPISFFEHGPRPLCWGGVGTAEVLTDIQIEMNWLLRKIQSCMNLATTHILVPDQAKMSDEQFTNGDMSLIRYAGPQAPKWETVQAISPEYYKQVEALWYRAFDLTGTSQAVSGGRKPSGVISGEAIRETNDLQSSRFQASQQGWERFHVDLGDRLIRGGNRLNKKLKGKGGYVVPIEDRGHLAPMKWDELEFDPDKDFYVLEGWPVSLLPDTPQGKIDKLIEMAQVGLADQKSALMMIGRGHPDVDALVNRAVAPKELCQRLIEDIIDKGTKGYKEPLPIYPLEMFIKEFGDAYMEAELDGVPQERLDLLMRWVKQAMATLKQAQPPAPPPGMVPPGPPGAVPTEAMPPGLPPGAGPMPEEMPQPLPPELQTALPGEGI